MQRTGTCDPRWVRGLDAVVEAVVLAVAVFTVLHLVAAPLGWPVMPVTWGWLVVAVPSGVGLVVRAVRGPAPGAGSPVHVTEPSPRPPRALLLGIPLVATLAVALDPSFFPVLWLPALLVAGAVWWWTARSARSAPPAPADPAGRREHAVALLMSVTLAGFMLFVRNTSADDVYYVNRSTWVAERGTFPLLDTMFGPEELPLTYGTGLPVTAVEELYGALAHVTGSQAGTVVYVVALPLLVLLSGWVTWRLIEAWAVRSRLVVLGVALVLPLFVATGLVGDFGPARMWQGKVVALGIVVPLTWLHLTRLGEAGTTTAERRRSTAVLGVLGLAWCGLTVTAPLLAAPVAVAALLAGWVVRHRRPLLLGAAALTAAPVLTGLATALVGDGRPVAEEEFIRDAGEAWTRVMGTDRLATGLLVLGLLAGPLLVRRGVGGVLAASAALGLVVAATPGTIAVVDAVTGAGPVAPRLLLVAPVHVLVALLVTVRWPTRSRPAGSRPRPRQDVVAAALALTVLTGSGTTAWDPVVNGALTDRPSWKVWDRELADVRALLAEDPGPGPVLLPELHMRVLAITTTRTFAAVPRTFYVSLLRDGYQRLAARQILRRFVDDERQDPPIGRLRAALVTVGVTVACASSGDSHVTALSRTGYLNRRTVGTLVCFDRPARLGPSAPHWPGGRPCEVGSPVPGPGIAGGACTVAPTPWRGRHLARPRRPGDPRGP